MAEDGSDLGQWQRGSGRARRGWVLLVVLALLAAACGAETLPGLTAESTTTTSSTTTTTTAPSTTTSSIDFDRPVDQLLTPLPDEATIAQVIELVEDMRGQTANVGQQIRRLVDFPNIDTPAGSQILDFQLDVRAMDDGEYRSGSRVIFRLPTDVVTLNQVMDDELRSAGWNRAGQELITSETSSQANLVFREPGTSADRTELTIAIDDATGVTMVEFRFHSQSEFNEDSFTRFQAWQSELSTPRGATVTETAIVTGDDIATLTVRYELEFETVAEARADLLGDVRLSDYELAPGTDEAEESVAPLVLLDLEGRPIILTFAETREEEIVEMVVSYEFPLEPIDP